MSYFSCYILIKLKTRDLMKVMIVGNSWIARTVKTSFRFRNNYTIYFMNVNVIISLIFARSVQVSHHIDEADDIATRRIWLYSWWFVQDVKDFFNGIRLIMQPMSGYNTIIINPSFRKILRKIIALQYIIRGYHTRCTQIIKVVSFT